MVLTNREAADAAETASIRFQSNQALELEEGGQIRDRLRKEFPSQPCDPTSTCYQIPMLQSTNF